MSAYLINPASLKSMAGKNGNNDQWSFLASLRFFLSLTVILGHYALLIKPDRHAVFGGSALLNPGSAVFGFFLLSGYSVSASLDRAERDFYLRRIVRIWPTYFACLALGLLVYIIVPNGFHWPIQSTIGLPTFLTIVASFLMLQTVIAGPIPSVGVIWSLSAEWWHYMIAPFLRKFPSGILVGAMVASFFVYMFVSPPPGGGPEGFEHGIGIIALSWMWVSGFLYHRHRQQRFGLLVICLPPILVLHYGHFIGVPMFISIFALIICETLKFSPQLRRTLDYLGDLSYPMYLFQVPVMIIVITLGSTNKYLIVGCIVLLSVASLHFIDYPCREAYKRHHRGQAGVIAGYRKYAQEEVG